MFKAKIQVKIEEGYFETEKIWKKHVAETKLLKSRVPVAIGKTQASIKPVIESTKKIAV